MSDPIWNYKTDEAERFFAEAEHWFSESAYTTEGALTINGNMPDPNWHYKTIGAEHFFVEAANREMEALATGNIPDPIWNYKTAEAEHCFSESAYTESEALTATGTMTYSISKAAEAGPLSSELAEREEETPVATLKSLVPEDPAKQEKYRQLFKPQEGFISLKLDQNQPGFVTVTRCYNENFLSYDGVRIQMPMNDPFKHGEMLDYCLKHCVINVRIFDFENIKDILVRARRIRIYVPFIVEETEIPYGTGENGGQDGHCTPEDVLGVLEGFRESAKTGTLKSIKFVTTFLGRSHDLSRTTLLRYAEDREFIDDFNWKIGDFFNGDMEHVERKWVFNAALSKKLSEREMFFLYLNLREIEDALLGGELIMEGPLKEEFDAYRIEKQEYYAKLPNYHYLHPRLPVDVFLTSTDEEGEAHINPSFETKVTPASVKDEGSKQLV